jgi:hypothetical protein
MSLLTLMVLVAPSFASTGKNSSSCPSSYQLVSRIIGHLPDFHIRRPGRCFLNL